MPPYPGLHLDLQPYVQNHGSGPMLNSPLVQARRLRPEIIPELNDFYEYKCKELDHAWEVGDYHKYVFLHERPFRIDALVQLRFDFGISRPYWEVVGTTWRDSENIQRWKDEWREIWSEEDKLGLRRFAMTRYERRYLRQLPESFIIYRGVGDPAGVEGMSWTLSRKLAAWFACRNRSNNDGKCLIATAEISRADVIAYFSNRREREVIVLPENLQVRSTQPQVDEVPKPWAASEIKMLTACSER